MITLLVVMVDGETSERQIEDDWSIVDFAAMVQNSQIISCIEIISVSPHSL